MDKLKKQINSSVFYTFFLNIAILLISVLLFHPQFEENDDAFLAMIAEGAYGTRDFHLIYSNVCLGKVLTACYAAFPSIRWHSVFQYFFLFLAFCLITYLLCRRRNGKMLSALFLLCVFYESYVLLQYTKTAVIATAAGYILLFEVIRRKHQTGKAPVGFLLSADLLLVYGALLRSSAFFLASAVMLCAGLYELYLAYRAEKIRGLFTMIFSYIKIYVPVLCLILLLFLVDNRAYTKDMQWNSFMTYNDTRMDLLDYRYDLLDYGAHAKQLEEQGISENDALLYLTWQFADDRSCSTDFMRSVLDGAGKRQLDITMLKAFASHLFEELYALGTLIPGLLCIIVVILLSVRVYDKEKKRGFWCFLLCSLCMTAVILLYYQYSGRWNHRVVYGLFLALLMALIYEGTSGESAPENETSVTDMQGMLLVLLLFFQMGLFLKNQFDYQDYLRSAPDYRAQTACMQENKDTLFVLDTFTFQQAYRYEVFRAYPCGALDNAVSAGSWFSNSPITKTITEKYGYTNPFDALEKGAGDVILVDNCYPAQKAMYLSEHTERTYEAEFLETRNGFDSYRMKEKTE